MWEKMAKATCGAAAGILLLLGGTKALNLHANHQRHQNGVAISEPRLMSRGRSSLPWVSSFVGRNQPRTTTAIATKCTTTMYFDDVSPRHVKTWDPASTQQTLPSVVASYAPQGPAPDADSTRNEESTTTETEHLGPLQMLLRGYTAESALELSNDQVLEQMELWATKVGLVGTKFGDELYDSFMDDGCGRVCATQVEKHGANTTSPVRAMALFWQAISNLITQHADDSFPFKWRESGSGIQQADSLSSKIFFAVFPTCAPLYEYKTLFTFFASIEFCKQHCLHLGKRFSVTLFHPHFEQQPLNTKAAAGSGGLKQEAGSNPERHSPFPALGLEFLPFCLLTRKGTPPPAEPSKPRQRGNHIAPKPPAMQATRFRKPSVEEEVDEDDQLLAEDDNLRHLVSGRIRDLEERRSSLEVLFNSPAVTDKPKKQQQAAQGAKQLGLAASIQKSWQQVATTATEESEAVDEDDPDDAGLQLQQRFQNERWRRRKSLLPHEQVLKQSQQWVKDNLLIKSSSTKKATVNNPALQFWQDEEEREEARSVWSVSDEQIAEKVYADLWQVIADLYETGMEAERDLALKAEEETSAVDRNLTVQKIPGGGIGTDESFGWMKSWGFHSSASKRSSDEKVKPNKGVTIKSHMFVATKFCAYNAQSFKRFAITVNAALSRLSALESKSRASKMFLEVFHPEYVGNKGYNNEWRRSPVPMLQICYHVQAPPQQESTATTESSSKSTNKKNRVAARTPVASKMKKQKGGNKQKANNKEKVEDSVAETRAFRKPEKL